MNRRWRFEQGEEIDTLSNVLEEFEGRQIYLQIYSTKRKELRGTFPSSTSSVLTCRFKLTHLGSAYSQTCR